ncbi:hypothetical protein D3C76_1680570 [compost metagenome]
MIGRWAIPNVFHVQGATQGLVQRIARQWTGLLLQRSKGGAFFAGHEVAVGGHQQDRCGEPRAQFEQAGWAVSNQYIGVQVVQ